MNGYECRFCHACAPGELKARKKMKVQRLRAQDAAAQAHSVAVWGSESVGLGNVGKM